ncbi:MAG: hypothetical protein ACOYXC_19575 [Candidatus Rifleibacteriota bacterium]
MNKIIKCLFGLLLFCSAGFGQNLVIEKIDHPLLNGKRICAVASENGLNVWATHNELVITHPDKRIEVFDHKNSPLIEAANISAVGICDGAIWVTQINSSNGYGIFHFDKGTWNVYKDPDNEGILNNRILRIHVDQDKTVWFGNEVHGVTKMVESIPIKFTNQKFIHLFNNRLHCLYMQLTHLWVGCNNGIVRFRSEIASNYYLNVDTWVYPEFPARAAYSVCEYGPETIAAGTDTGLALYDGKKWSILKKNAGIKALPALHLIKDGKFIWIGSSNGLQRWQLDTSSEILTTESGLPGNRVTCMTLENQGTLLVGTETGAAIIKSSN